MIVINVDDMRRSYFIVRILLGNIIGITKHFIYYEKWNTTKIPFKEFSITILIKRNISVELLFAIVAVTLLFCRYLKFPSLFYYYFLTNVNKLYTKENNEMKINRREWKSFVWNTFYINTRDMKSMKWENVM